MPRCKALHAAHVSVLQVNPTTEAEIQRGIQHSHVEVSDYEVTHLHQVLDVCLIVSAALLLLLDCQLAQADHQRVTQQGS